MKYLIGFLKEIKQKAHLIKCRHCFRKRNQNNKMRLDDGHFSLKTLEKIIIGNYSYGSLNVMDYDDGCKLRIGSYCSIAKNVVFIMGGEHRYNTLSTYPFGSIFDNRITSFSKGDIVIEDDVWIGYGSIILSNVRIGKGAIVAAGSVIVKDIPPYSIWGGNPAKFIKNRFSDEIIKKLLNYNYASLTEDKYKKLEAFLNREITGDNIDEILNGLLS